MKPRIVLLIFFISLIASIIPDLLPYLWVTYQGKERVQFIGSLTKFQSPCSKQFPNSDCKIEYKIPIDFLNGRLLDSKSILGLGYFLTDYAIKCDDEIVLSPRSNEAPSLLIDSYKTYKIIDLAGLNCSNSAFISILALNTPGIPQHGQISSNAVFGERSYVAALKRTIEFLSSGIYIIYALILLFSLYELKVLLRPLIRIRKERSSELEYSGIAWAAFSIFKSGILDIFFLTPSSVNILFRAQSGFSLFGHLQPLICSSDGIKISKKVRLGILGLILLGYIPFALSPFYVSYIVYIGLSFAVIRIITFFFVPQRNWTLLAFSVCTAIECVKSLQLRSLPLPVGSISAAFIVVLQLHRSIEIIKSAGVFAAVNLWLRRTTASVSEKPEIYPLLASFLEQIPAKHISFFRAFSQGTHELYSYSFGDKVDNNKSPRYLDDVPVGFSHVLTTSRNLLHRRDDDPSFYRIFRRAPKSELGSYYSIFPVYSSKKLIGVAAVSKYSFNPLFQAAQRERFEAFVPAFLDVLGLMTERRDAIVSDARLNKLSKVIDEAIAEDSFEGPQRLFNSILEKLNTEFAWKGFFGIYNPTTTFLDIIALSYKDQDGGKNLLETSWEMKIENERGPAPQALFQEVDVIVPDVEWIKNTVSDYTKAFFQISETKSILVIPIRRIMGSEKHTYGLLWLSSSAVGEFDTSTKRCATFMRESVENTLSRMLHSNIDKVISRGQLRPDIHERIMRGEDPLESGEGFVLNVDLAKSTDIPKVIGKVRWEEFQRVYALRVLELGNKYGFKAQMMIWDAIFLTSSSVPEEQSLFEFTKEFLEVCAQLFREFGVDKLYQEPKFGGRVCATYGDITCLVNRGTWSLTDQMIAFMSKFESTLKGTSVGLAITPELFRKVTKFDKLNEQMVSGKKCYAAEYSKIFFSA